MWSYSFTSCWCLKRKRSVPSGSLGVFCGQAEACWLGSGCCCTGVGIGVGALLQCWVCGGMLGFWAGLGAEAFGSATAMLRAQGLCILHCHLARGTVSSSVSDEDEDDGERQWSCCLRFLFFFLDIR